MKQILALGLAVMLASGCATNDERKTHYTEGMAVAGALLGAVIGNNVGDAGDNTAMGAAAGAVVGGIIGKQYDDLNKDLDKKNVQIEKLNTEKGELLKLTMQSSVLFDFDRSDIRNEAADTLVTIADSINKYRDTDVFVVGHTDAKGSEQYNQALGQRRANAVADFFVDYNVSPGRLDASSMGETSPVAENSTEAGRQLNRRVEIFIKPRS